MKVLVALLSFAALLPSLALGQGAVVYQTEGRIDGESAFCSAQFQLVAGHLYTVETSNLSEGCDTVAELRRPAERERAHDDDPVVGRNDDAGLGNRASRLDWLCDRSGTYYVAVTAFSTSGAGTFNLTVRDKGQIREVLNTQGTIDGKTPFYSPDFELTAGLSIIARTSDLSTGCDTVIELRRSTDRERARDDDPVVAQDDDGGESIPSHVEWRGDGTGTYYQGGGSLSSRIVWTCDRTATYYVAVRCFSEQRAGSFTLTVQESTSAAGPVYTDSGTVDGKRPVYSDYVGLTAGTTYVVETSDLSEGCDPVIELRRSTDAEQTHDDDPVVAQNDDVTPGDRNARIEWTCDRTGRYYVKISAFTEASAGSFTITVSEE